ncbi:MAG TPA: BatA domain-containing protein [Candidatus Binatia bacterium]
MSVFFLYPIFLFGLVAASLPLLIHLLNRRKLNRIRFPAVRFILMSQKRISRSYRLRHWILLALRTMAVVLLALLLANPIFQTGAGLFAGGGPVSLVILLDNSLSMTWSGDGIGFKQAKEAARLLITSLGDSDRAAIVPTSISGKEPIRLKVEKDVLLKELDQIEIADGTANFSTALAKAYELLGEPAGQKEIRLITDLGLTGWDNFSMSSLKQVDPAIPVKAIRVGRKQKPLNVAVKEIRAAGQGIGVDLPLHLEAVVANFSDQEIKELLVQLSIDGQNKDQKLTSVPPRGDATITLQARLSQAGSHTGQLTIKKDGLAGNASMHFGVHAQDQLRVLVVDGDPQTSLVQSETFFLTRALNPAGESDSSQYLPTVIIPEALSGAALDSYQVIVLCNVASLPDSFIAKLQNYLRAGGGLLIFGGDRLQADHYNAKLAQILQTPIRDKKQGLEASGEKIGKMELTHPALQSLSDNLLQESIKSARIWGYSRISASGKSVLMSLANGDPLLIEQKVGSGRVIFITTTADRDWSDLPVKTAYLPMIQSLTNYLAGGKRGLLDGGISVGDVKQISLPPGYVGKTIGITKPNKQPAEVVMNAAQDRASGSFEDNDVAGIYQLALKDGDQESGTPRLYAVNPPFLESRLEEISERELQAKLSPVRADVVPIESLRQGGIRRDLALPLLGLLLATLLLEGWFAQRI